MKLYATIFAQLLLLFFPIKLAAQNGAAFAGFETSISDNVPISQVKSITEGLELSETYFASLGFKLPSSSKSKWRIQVVATGKGNTSRGGGGACCTAFSGSQRAPVLFFDVAHGDWRNAHQAYGRKKNKSIKTVVHEYVHGIQGFYGAVSYSHKSMPAWMVEGMAEYLAYEAMFKTKRLDRRKLEKFQATSAFHTGELKVPLSKMVSGNGHPWPGHIGHIAVIGLVDNSGKGPVSLFEYMKRLRNGERHDQAFKLAFGISLGEFYARFEQYQTKNKRRPNPNPYWLKS